MVERDVRRISTKSSMNNTSGTSAKGMTMELMEPVE